MNRARLARWKIGACWVLCLASPGWAADRLAIGGIKVKPRLEVSATYDDNVFISETNKQGDVYVTLSPGVRLLQGDPSRNYISLDYTAGIQRYFRLRSENTVNHALKLSSRLESSKLIWKLSYEFQDFTSPQVEVGGRLQRQQQVSLADVEYRFSPKTSVGLNYRYDTAQYSSPGQISSQHHEVGTAFYYRYSPKTDLFGQFNYGLVHTEVSAGNATYQQVNVGVRTRPVGKIVGTAKVGYQHYDYEGPIGRLDSWVASANLQANLTERTITEFSFSRDISPSITTAGNAYTVTRVGVTLKRRTGAKMILYATGVYEHDGYEMPVGGVERTDDFWETALGADYNFTPWFQVGTAYRHRQNGSTAPLSSFDNNIFTIRATASF